MAILSFYAGANGGGSADKLNVVNVSDLYDLNTDSEEINLDAYIQQAGITMDEFLALFKANTIAIKDESTYVFKNCGFDGENQKWVLFGALGRNMGEMVEIFYDNGIVTSQFYEI